jgi:hypothetical protein
MIVWTRVREVSHTQGGCGRNNGMSLAQYLELVGESGKVCLLPIM